MNRLLPTGTGSPTTIKLTSAVRRPGDPANCLEAALQQGCLAKQVGTRVAGDAELGKQDDITVGNLVQNPHHFRSVSLGIGHRGSDGSTGDADETKSVHTTNPAAQPRTLGLGQLRPAPTTRIIGKNPQVRLIDRLSDPRVEQYTQGFNGLEFRRRFSPRAVLTKLNMPAEAGA